MHGTLLRNPSISVKYCPSSRYESVPVTLAPVCVRPSTRGVRKISVLSYYRGAVMPPGCSMPLYSRLCFGVCGPCLRGFCHQLMPSTGITIITSAIATVAISLARCSPATGDVAWAYATHSGGPLYLPQLHCDHLFHDVYTHSTCA